MRKVIRVNLKSNAYNIVVGNNILSDLGRSLKKLSLGQDAVIITNNRVFRLHGRTLVSGLKRSDFSVKTFKIADTEESKSSEVALDLLRRIARYDTQKKIFIVAFGGGVVGDLAGFLASVYKRGIAYVQVPTTLLAQVDSAIGGKTAIDLPLAKNLIGAFYQPRIVWSDVSVLSTLDKRQIRNGLAEVVKYGVIADRNLFHFVQQNHRKILSCDLPALRKVILACSRVKAQIVSKDEKEDKGLRTTLNFGHTIGHAIEAAGQYNRYQHGEAVAIGMCIAARMSCLRGSLKEKDYLALQRLVSDLGLPQKAKGIALKRILKIMAHDKKFKGAFNRFVLPLAIGKVKVIQNIPKACIAKAVRAHLL